MRAQDVDTHGHREKMVVFIAVKEVKYMLAQQ